MESKNIERLFQEKLRDLEFPPDPQVWKKIENSLLQKKKKKVMVLWWRNATVAAAFLLGLFLYMNPPSAKKIDLTIPTENSVTDSKKTFQKNIKNQQEKPAMQPLKNRSIIVGETPSEKENIPPKTSAKTTIPKPVIAALENNDKTEKTIAENETKKMEFDSKKTEKTDPEKIILKNNPTTSLAATEDISEVVEETKKEISKQKSWSIASTVSQVFLQSFSQKSTIDSRFDAAEKSGNKTASIGIKIAYQPSKKWQFQTGIHKLELGQTTQQITINNSASFASINSFGSNNPLALLENSDALITSSSKEIKTTEGNQNLNQTYGYIEIPLEVKYALTQNPTLSLHLVTGFSTLFLTTNELIIESDSFIYTAGKANNLNAINYSLNLGTAIEYHFAKQWFFDVAPMLKFQTNTFERSSNQPYYFGFSTGINYKF